MNQLIKHILAKASIYLGADDGLEENRLGCIDPTAAVGGFTKNNLDRRLYLLCLGHNPV